MGHLCGEQYRRMDRKRKRKKESGMERGYKEEGDCSVARACYLPLQIWYLTSPLCSLLLSPHQFSTSLPSFNPLPSLHNILCSHQLMSPCDVFSPFCGPNSCFIPLCSSRILTLYKGRIYIFVHLLNKR